MKIKSILLLISILFLSISVEAQMGSEKGRRHRGGFDVEKHHQERAKFISKELNLTEEEKKAFIPVMEEFIHARFTLNRELRRAARELDRKENKTNEDYQKVIDMGLDVRAKEVELQKKYYLIFKEILSPEKIYKYHAAEKDFMHRTIQRHHRMQEDGADK